MTSDPREDELHALRARLAELEGERKERQRLERALQESDERLRSVIESTPGLVHIMDRQGRLLFINGPIESTHYEELVAKFPIASTANRSEIEAVYADVFKTGRGGQYELRLATGEGAFLCRVSPIRDDGRVVAALTMLLDVTSERRTEAVLRANEERFRALTERAYDLITEVDAQGHPIYISPNHEQVLGYTVEEIRTQYQGMLPAEDIAILAAELETLGPDESTGNIRTRTVARDGRVLWFESSARRFRTHTGDDHTIFVARDITERVASEDERRRYAGRLEAEVARRTEELERANRDLRLLQGRLIAAERLGAAGELAGTIAHAIIDPLSALIGTLQMRRESAGKLDPAIERSLHLARRLQGVAERAIRLGVHAELRRVSVYELLEAVRAELQGRCTELGIDLHVHEPASGGHVLVDRDLMHEALRAIADNAIESMQGGGTLCLESERLGTSGVVALRISDTGSGIDPAMLPNIFEPHVTTKATGAGLGLSIARGVVQGHSGRILIDERPEGGTRVSVELPSEVSPS
jgi:PAS domain S-box-containing protein